MPQTPPPQPHNSGNPSSTTPNGIPPTPPAQIQFFVARSGNNDGPYSLQQLNAQVASGAVKSNDLVWYEGAAGWMPVGQISGISAPQKITSAPSLEPQDETTIFEVTPSILPDLILCVLTCGLWLCILPWRYLTVLSCKYRLTTERLIITAGVIGKSSQELEIYRVKDVTVDLPLVGRMMGLGTVIVAANDSSSPRVELIAVSDAERVKEQIRQASRAARKAEGVRSVEYMPPS